MLSTLQLPEAKMLSNIYETLGKQHVYNEDDVYGLSEEFMLLRDRWANIFKRDV